VVGLVLAQRRGLDLVVDDSRQHGSAIGPPGLEIEVAEDAPLLSVVPAVNARRLLGFEVADMSSTLAS
jgi:hypothetical protein